MSPSYSSSQDIFHPEPSRTSSTESAEAIRKRVCKACDRCRLKKSKCDGANPCSRCIADNAICVFGERKKSHDKIYPKGYVEMLEQQQGQLVQGLQETYHLMLAAGMWKVPALSEETGRPLTHDILAALGLLENRSDSSEELLPFEENVGKLQARLVAEGAAYTTRRGSSSSESEHSHREPSSRSTPSRSKPPARKERPRPKLASPSGSQTPAASQQKPLPPAKPSPLHIDLSMTNAQLFQWPQDQTLAPANPMSLLSNNAYSNPPLQQNVFDTTNMSGQDLMTSPMSSEFDASFYQPMDDFNFMSDDFDQTMDLDFRNSVAMAS